MSDVHVPSTSGRSPTTANLHSVYQGLFELCPFTKSLNPASAEVTIDGGRFLFTPREPEESRLEDPGSRPTQLEELVHRFPSAGNTDERRVREAKMLRAISVLNHCEGIFRIETQAGAGAQAEPEPRDTARDEFSQSERIQYLKGWPNAYISDRSFDRPSPHIMNVTDSHATSASESGASLFQRSRHIAWWTEEEAWSVSFYSSMTSESPSHIGEEVESHPSTVVDWIVESSTLNLDLRRTLKMRTLDQDGKTQDPSTSERD